MWLYVPGTASASAQALAGLNSASNSPCDFGEKLCEASASWKGKLLPSQAWSRQWKRGGFIRRLSGLTCLPSTLDRGVDAFISSLPEIHVRTIQSRETGLEKTESDSSPQKSVALPKSAGLILSSVKTCRGTRINNSEPSSRHWSDWSTALRREYSVRPELATPCGASDCSSWPSPTVKSEAQTAKNPTPGQTGGDSLKGVAQECEAPSVAVTEGSRLARGGSRSDELLLTGQSIAVSEKWASPKASAPEKAGPNMRGSKGDVPLPGQAANWPGPAARDHKGSSADCVIRQDGKSRADMLDFAAEQFFRQPSSPDQPIAGGSMSSTDSPNSNQPSAKRKLNPIFVEALMRWPTGLSGFVRPETAWIQWLHVQLSFLSALYSAPEQDRQMDLFA